MFAAPFFIKTLLLATYVVNKLSPDLLVRLNHGGNVRGSILRSNEGRPFYAFRGIPYAEPPVGELRFKPPIPKSGWDSTPFDATHDGPVCFQQVSKLSFIGSEDCLVLNVYTPEIPKNHTNKRAVMVYIHGGSFLEGDGRSDSLSPRPLMDYNVVLVTMNYRLEALGFLSTGDTASPGNYGLLDQRLALLWIKDNIEAFGGDAQSVTIFGQSAGGACVSYHLLSPLSKGLFHRAIAMSGSPLNPWGFEPNPVGRARHVAKEAGCPEDSTDELINCLRSKPIEAVVLGILHYSGMSSVPVPLRPTIDGYFLPAHPKEIMKSPEKTNNVPVLTGITTAEIGAIIWQNYMFSPPGTVTSDKFLHVALNNSISNNDMEIMKLIKDRYLSEVDLSDERTYARALIKASTDGLFSMNHYEEVQLLSEAGLSVYAYSFNYVTKSLEEILFPYSDRLNASFHSDELFLIFELELGFFRILQLTESDRRMAKILMTLWTNFAKNGHPDPTNQYHLLWRPSTPDVIHIHQLDLELSSKEYAVNEDELFHFWTNDVYLARIAKTIT